MHGNKLHKRKMKKFPFTVKYFQRKTKHTGLDNKKL